MLRAIPGALSDILSLRNLDGGGHGCNDVDDSFSKMRRWLHHAVFYGFLCCLASTAAAHGYHHFLGLLAPYPLTSLPVLLGAIGGVGIIVGCVGLASSRRSPIRARMLQRLKPTVQPCWPACFWSPPAASRCWPLGKPQPWACCS